MSTDLHDLRAVLAARADLDPAEAAAARARFDALLTDATPVVVVRPEPVAAPVRRRPRRLAVAVVAAAVVALVASVVALTAGTGRPTERGPALGSDDALALTQWLFTVQPVRLPEHLSVVQYVHADPTRQVAAVLSPQDAATSNHYSAVVELAADPATLGVATRPADARSVGPDAWTSPHTAQEFGVSGVQLVWTTPSGYTMRILAGDGAAAQTIRDATDVAGWEHPVRFPVAVAADWFPAGSRVVSYDFVGVFGVSVVVDVAGGRPVRLGVAGGGILADHAVTTPFGNGFAAVADPDASGVRVLTSSLVDLQVVYSDTDSAQNTLPVSRLRELLAGAQVVGMADQQAWFPLVDALPTG